MLLGLMLLTAVIGWQAPSVQIGADVVVSYYDVGGRTAREVRRELARNRPSHAGQASESLSRWTSNTVWSHDAHGRCLSNTVRVERSMMLQLPRLTDGRDLTRAQRERWDAYLARLTEIEMGRLQTVNTSLDEMQDSLRKTASCEELLDMRTREVARIETEFRTLSKETQNRLNADSF